MTVVTEIRVDGFPYKVRHDYLHRGTNPRLVLEEKDKGMHVKVQFDRTALVQQNIENANLKPSYDGYWVDRSNKLKPIKVTIEGICITKL